MKEKNRTLSWLAGEMGKTFDGLKLSLVKGSLKYNDVITLSKVLGIKPGVLFETEEVAPEAPSKNAKTVYNDCLELVAILKSQLKDKDQIIALLKNKTIARSAFPFKSYYGPGINNHLTY